MGIPVSTTKIRVLSGATAEEPQRAGAWGDAADLRPVSGPIRAHLSGPSGSAIYASEGNSVGIGYKLIADPCDIGQGDRVEDLTTGLVYDVAWAQPRPMVGGYTIAGLTLAVGSA